MNFVLPFWNNDELSECAYTPDDFLNISIYCLRRMIKSVCNYSHSHVVAHHDQRHYQCLLYCNPFLMILGTNPHSSKRWHNLMKKSTVNLVASIIRVWWSGINSSIQFHPINANVLYGTFWIVPPYGSTFDPNNSAVPAGNRKWSSSDDELVPGHHQMHSFVVLPKKIQWCSRVYYY